VMPRWARCQATLHPMQPPPAMTTSAEDFTSRSYVEAAPAV